MIVKFGNLVQPRHSEDPEKPEAKDKITEMMDKLHKAGHIGSVCKCGKLSDKL